MHAVTFDTFKLVRCLTDTEKPHVRFNAAGTGNVK